MSGLSPAADPRPSVSALLGDPAVRRPLKVVLRDWSLRDPVDAAEDAELLFQALGRAADEAIGRLAAMQTEAGECGHAWPLD